MEFKWNDYEFDIIKKMSKDDNLDYFKLLEVNRSKPYVLLRFKIADFFRYKNYTYQRIAFILNLKAHNNVIYLLKTYGSYTKSR